MLIDDPPEPLLALASLAHPSYPRFPLGDHEPWRHNIRLLNKGQYT
jgi:hypothetical protein